MRADLLHVVGAYSNPRRYAVRPRLARQWISDTLDSGVRLTLVEHAFGDRPYEFSQAELPYVNLVQVRGGPEQELWLQHALYNRGFATLPDDARYVCWQDTDIKHLRADWAVETMHMLQHYRVGQTWTNCFDLDPCGNIAVDNWDNEVDRSFSAAWQAGEVGLAEGPYQPVVSRALLPDKRKRDWRVHTGYSWAMRRDALRGLGRLLDWMIIGSGDYHMAHGFAGNLRQMVEQERQRGDAQTYGESYFRRLLQFCDLCDQSVKQDIGCVPGVIQHGWHGSKLLRFYGSREDVMRESRFDPDRDIAYDVHGLPYLCSDNRLLRDGLRRYNTRRNEDSIDVYTKAGA
jgi:hypothetical protein